MHGDELQGIRQQMRTRPISLPYHPCGPLKQRNGLIGKSPSLLPDASEPHKAEAEIDDCALMLMVPLLCFLSSPCLEAPHDARKLPRWVARRQSCAKLLDDGNASLLLLLLLLLLNVSAVVCCGGLIESSSTSPTSRAHF